MLPDTDRIVLATRGEHRKRVGRADLSASEFRDEYDGFEDLFRANDGDYGNISVRNR